MRRSGLRFALLPLLWFWPVLSAFAMDCGAARGLKLEITTITLAEVSSGTLTTPYGETIEGLPAFCRVAGVLRPTADSRIHFEVWMPVEGWSGRYLGVGNGGFAGTIGFDQMGSRLRQGFATAGTDAGHEGNAEDAGWAFHHPEKVVDYGYRALHLTTLRAKEIVAAVYGHGAQHAYFDSCSNGGREALMEAQRFPEDFDGILAGAPANNWTAMLSSSIDVAQTMFGDPARYISSMKLPAIHRAVLQACDTLDGVKDGIVSDPSKCQFDPASLLCKGEDELGCLTAPQVKTLAKLYGGGTTEDGKQVFPGLLPGSELPGWASWVTGMAPGAGAAYPGNYFRYMVTGNPSWEILTANTAASLKQAEAVTGKDLNATEPDLRPFARRGGKLMMYHGWNDPAISPWATIAYYGGVRQRLGTAVDGSVRLYMVPGMEHCAGGPGPNLFGQLGLPSARGEGSGMLDALEGWVEKGAAPSAVLAAKFSGSGKTASATITRPLCPYPQTARYDGSGDASQPESFTCKAE